MQNELINELTEFFKDDENYAILHRAFQIPGIDKIVDFFVTTSEHPIMEIGGVLTNITDLYRKNVRVYHKHLFNFIDRENKGKVVINGETNPKLLVGTQEMHAEYGIAVRATLAKLNAYRFAIESGALETILDNIDDIKTKYRKHIHDKKAIYVRNHLSRTAHLMEIAKNTVIQERVSDTQNKTRLSRLEKAKVRDILNKLKETERSKKIPTKAASSSRAKTDKKQKMVLKISSSIKE